MGARAGGVALLAEGVDRNYPDQIIHWMLIMSPSSRRAWIEIPERLRSSPPLRVALLAEGVDRNVFRDFRPGYA